MREIVLDTETTGLDAKKGDRLIEIGCVEIVNRQPTGRRVPRASSIRRRGTFIPTPSASTAYRREFLRDKPLFGKVGRPIPDVHRRRDRWSSTIASFDIGFINMELERLKLSPIAMDRVVDTLALARRKHPAGPNTLDALCKRYGIDNSQRTKHGAMVDSLLLAQVYVELLGERQATLGLARDGATPALPARWLGGEAAARAAAGAPAAADFRRGDAPPTARSSRTLGDNAIWRRYLELEASVS